MESLKLFRTLVLLGVLVQSLPCALAQESIDLATVSGRYGFPTIYAGQESAKAEEAIGLVNLKAPIIFSDKLIWFSSLTYTQSRVLGDIVGSDFNPDPIDLYAFILQSGLIYRTNESNAFHLLFVPRLMTDFRRVTAESWQWGAIGMYEHKYSEKLTMRYGVMYNGEWSGALFVPLIDVNWKISPKWSLSGLLPIYGKLNYQINPNTITGLSFFGLITSYDLSKESYANSYMERRSIDLALFGRQRLFGNFHAELRFGYAIGRAYEQYDKSEKIDARISLIRIGDNRGEPLNPQFDPGLFTSIRLVYNLPIE